ncbi:hypothetical protein C3B54_11214 [Pontimonas salivibrio]|uniref:DUF4190 domain-containing protein n=1 Tax=Pontimonas salivibrio TaxID=1159327 RepID=A0A2L2BNJ7_9MICO|nr:hypothetical protein [Pontimonas salivibrio]AVG23217.1 hypothetical protein C3B54_11214 [Pontimonas salivibrio]
MAEATSGEAPIEHTPTNSTDEWTEYPGRTLGVVALVLAFFSQIPALIMGIIAWVWSNKVGRSNVPAKVAVAVSATLLVLIVLAIVGWTALIVSLSGELGGFGMNGFDMDDF